MSSPTNESVIHDIGFRHYDGPRLGRGWAFRSLLLETLRGCYGLGRPSKVKAMPWVLTGMMLAPALILVVITIVTGGAEFKVSYTQYIVCPVWLLTAMFVAGRAPYAISRDLRDGVMPLYLSRPILRRDYVLAKFCGVAIGTFLYIAAPVLVLLIGALLAKFPVWHETTAALGGLAMAAVLALILTGLSMLLASISRRKGLGVAAIMTTLVLASGFAGILIGILELKVTDASAAYAAVLDPFALVDGLAASWLGVTPFNFGVTPDGFTGGLVFTLVFVAIVTASLTLVMRRFKKVGGV